MPPQRLSVKAGRRVVEVSKPDKPLFPDGITKADLVRYYADVAGWMLPHVRDRPISTQRFPDGIEGKWWFEKQARDYFPDWIPRVEVPKRGGTVSHVLANEPATLAYLAQQASITPHVFLSRADRLDRPDRLIVDLDPSLEDFAAVKVAARATRALLESLGLPVFAQVTGSRGIHVVVPLRRRHAFDAVEAFARALAERLVAEHPQALTLEFFKEKREDRILVDVMRNRWAQTVVPPYAVRPKPGAPVATPVAWEELDRDDLRPGGWTLRTVLDRLRERGDPWADMQEAAAELGPAIRELAA